MKITLEDGSVVETSIDPREAEKVLREKADLEAKSKSLEDEISKLKSKDTNFSKFRKATAEEKAKMLESFSDKERSMYSELDSLKTELGEYKSRNFKTYQEKLLKSLSNGDKDLERQILDASQSFAGEPQSETDMETRLRNAYTLVRGARPSQNPIHSFSPSDGSHEEYFTDRNATKFTDTEDGKKLYESSFPHLIKRK